MKVSIIGVGAVGTACAKAMLLRGTCHEVVLVDVDENRARGVANDLSHAAVLCPPAVICAGSYDEISGSAVVAITAGINEKSGGAINRSEKLGRLRLLPHNAQLYKEIVPQVSRAAPEAVILVITDPPDPLADVARELAQQELGYACNQVVSSGTYLDTLRFRFQIARRLGCHPASVDAQVIGEHGTSQVYVWSSARVGSESILDRVRNQGADVAAFRAEVEDAVRYANIAIIEGTGASQHGISVVTARLVEAMLRDEGLVAPVGIFHDEFRVTLSLPSVIGRGGVRSTIKPSLNDLERELLGKSAEAIQKALAQLG